MEYTAIKPTKIQTSSTRSRLALCVFNSEADLLDMARDLGNAGIASENVVVLSPDAAISKTIAGSWQAADIEPAIFTGGTGAWQAHQSVAAPLAESASELVQVAGRLIEKHVEPGNIILLIKFLHGDAETLISGVLLAGSARWVEVHDLAMIA